MIWNGYNFDSFRDYLQKKATPIFFSRASIAFDVNGNAVNANVPRYNNGIMVEESTTNLLTANQSNGCEDGTTTGFSGSTGTTLSSSTDWYAGGNASLKAVCDGTASNQGYNLSTRPLAVSGLIYAGQVKIYGLTGDVTVYLNFYDSSSNQLSANSQNITLNGTTQTGVVTGTAPANAASVSLMVRTNGAQSVTFYVDMLQIEQKSYPTSWTLGGTTRSGEFYKAYSAQNLINASKGTFEVTVNIPPYWKGGNNYAVFWEFLNTGGTDKLYLGSASGTNNLFVVINDSAGGTKTLTSENNVLTPGEHVISVTWNNTGNIGSIYLDGIP